MVKKTPKPKFNKYARNENTKSIQSFIVIAVEGDRSEPNYFKMIAEKFKDNVRLKIIPSEKKSSPKNLLESCKKIKREYSCSEPKEKPDSIWMVCDVDCHKNLQLTISSAKKEGIKVAISNPCFEVWLFSHLAEIKLENRSTKFLNSKNEVLFLVDNSKKPSRNLSKKVKNILQSVRPQNGTSCYKGIYSERIEIAIKKSKENLKNISLEDFLLDHKHIGRTRVGELLEEIIKKV